MNLGKETENALQCQMKQLEAEHENPDKMFQEVRKEEEAYNDRLGYQFIRLEEISARCGALYPEGAGYIADCQNALNHQRVSSEEFLDELKIFVRKKHQELDMQEEAVYQQLLELQGNNS